MARQQARRARVTTRVQQRARVQNAVEYDDRDDRVVFRNGDGAWTISKRRGYITRFTTRDGSLICADLDNAEANLNNSCHGALGAFGCHIARRNEWYPDLARKYNFSWDLTERIEPARNGFGVARADVEDGPRVTDGVGRLQLKTYLIDMATNSEPILSVRRQYVVEEDNLKCLTTVTSEWDSSGPTLFIKEPKLVAHSLGCPDGDVRYRYLDVFDRPGNLLAEFDLWLLPDPQDRTFQIGAPGRARVRFQDANRQHAFNVVMEGSDGNHQQPWTPATVGFDRWAQDANDAERFLADGAAYCLKGPGHTLTRQWEATRFSVLEPGQRRPAAERGTPVDPDPEKPQVGVMFHAWEGGTGYSDCFCAARKMPSKGTKYMVYSCYSYGAGWVV